MYEVIIMNRYNGHVTRKKCVNREIAEQYLNSFRETHEKNWRTTFRSEMKYCPLVK